jgi:DNA repair protein RecO (recombination protein O)
MSREEKITGIVLKKQTLGEADELVTLFTKEKGKIRVKVVSAKRIGNRLRGSLLPISEVRIRIVEAGTIPKLIGAETLLLFRGIHESPEKVTFFYWLSEVMIKATADEVEDPRLYLLIKKALQKLDALEEDSQYIQILLCYTAIRLVEVIGFSLSLDKDPVEYVKPLFSNSLGGFFEAGEVPDGIPVSLAVVKSFNSLKQSSAEQLPQRLERIDELRTILLAYVSFQLERPIHSSRFI